MADRLAAGLSPAAAALAEGEQGAALVEALLAQEDFRELVEATRESLAEPPEVQRRQLVMLARQTLERAMAWDGDPRAALFILEEDARGRDPAETLADGVQKARRRAVASASPTAATPSTPEPEAPPGRAAGYDPLQAMVHRGAARLRDMVRIEDAIRLAAEHGAVTAYASPTTTRPRHSASALHPSIHRFRCATACAPGHGRADRARPRPSRFCPLLGSAPIGGRRRLPAVASADTHCTSVFAPIRHPPSGGGDPARLVYFYPDIIDTSILRQ